MIVSSLNKKALPLYYKNAPTCLQGALVGGIRGWSSWEWGPAHSGQLTRVLVHWVSAPPGPVQCQVPLGSNSGFWKKRPTLRWIFFNHLEKGSPQLCEHFFEKNAQLYDGSLKFIVFCKFWNWVKLVFQIGAFRFLNFGKKRPTLRWKWSSGLWHGFARSPDHPQSCNALSPKILILLTSWSCCDLHRWWASLRCL